MQFLRAFGIPIELSSALPIQLTVTLTNGTSFVTLSGSPISISAGKYKISEYCNALRTTIIAWLQARIASNPSLSSTGIPVVEIEFIPSTMAGQSRVNLALRDPQCEFNSGGDASYSFASIQNLNGAYSILGLAYRDPASSSRNAIISNGQAIFSGLFQPRSIFVFERSEIDEGEDDRPAQFVAHKLANGALRTYVIGQSRISKQRMRIVDMDPEVCGPPIEVALTASINGTRTGFVVQAGSTFGMTGIQVAFSLPMLIQPGLYLEIQGFVARIRSVSATSIILCETIPNSITLAGTVTYLRLVSEVHALWNEALQLGEILVYNTSDSTGEILWYPQSYCLVGDETPRFFGERRDIGNALYSYTFSLLRRDIEG